MRPDNNFPDEIVPQLLKKVGTANYSDDALAVDEPLGQHPFA
jgi:hypothetical protein